ncbi:nudix hydrolase 13, mitochondrial [Vitis vinifera]|nr:nudix hydrolase 13, mitochondrial [Vitis vinifera]|eukprot:XP_002273187.1 PREDICTED: nudix hydrolase 13, mitochondrial isoform X1 [Vitis vinifera]
MMSSVQARIGRERQRYKDHLRLVAGCIPFKFEKIVDGHTRNPESRLLVLMISSPNRHDLVFPKGGWENDETVEQAACREALEEAGVRGILGENHLGEWEFRSKSKQNNCSLEGGCRGYMFALQVTEELESWPEQALHDRKWLTPKDAFKLCRYDWMREALKNFLTSLPEDKKNEMREELVEFSMMPVPDAAKERSILSSGRFGKTSVMQRLEGSYNKVTVQA